MERLPALVLVTLLGCWLAACGSGGGGSSTSGSSTSGSSTSGSSTSGSSSSGSSTSGGSSSGGSSSGGSAFQGSHAFVSQAHGGGASPATTNTVSTQVAGSTFLVSAGAYPIGTIQSISDNKGNTYTLVDSQTYWGNRAEAKLWKCENCTGGAGHTWSITKAAGQTTNEITVFVVEIRNTALVRAWSVKHTATGLDCTDIGGVQAGDQLVSFVYGDASGSDSFTPNTGFDRLDQEPALDGNHVQGASAGQSVTASGTYGCLWTTTGNSGTTGLNPVRWLVTG